MFEKQLLIWLPFFPPHPFIGLSARIDSYRKKPTLKKNSWASERAFLLGRFFFFAAVGSRLSPRQPLAASPLAPSVTLTCSQRPFTHLESTRVLFMALVGNRKMLLEIQNSFRRFSHLSLFRRRGRSGRGLVCRGLSGGLLFHPPLLYLPRAPLPTIESHPTLTSLSSSLSRPQSITSQRNNRRDQINKKETKTHSLPRNSKRKRSSGFGQ